MTKFRIAQPENIEQLGALLETAGDSAVLMAGGTDLLDELKSGIAAPEIVVDLHAVPGLAGITRRKDGLEVGAMTTIAALAEHADIRGHYSLLHEAALSLATPQIRNVGTVGGNLCQRPRCWYYRDPAVICRKKGGFNCFAAQGRNKYHAILGGNGCYIVYPSDLAPALISLKASVIIGGVKGDRTLPLEDFYRPPSTDVRRENILEKGQFVKMIRIPTPPGGHRGAYVKLKERGTWDFALVSAAVSGVPDGKTFSDISIVMGGVAPTPWRLNKAENALRGRAVTETLIEQAVDGSLEEASPLSENGYKADLVCAAVKKAITAILQDQ